MKNIIAIFMCALCILSGIAQSDLSGDQLVIPERTPALEALYQQARDLEQNGTAAQINANRLAIRDAWQEIDPKVAALYKPIETEQSLNLGGDDIYIPSIIKKRPDSPESWKTDKLISANWIDGVDMDVTGTGDIYIGVYENIIDFGGTNDSIHVYKSTNHGRTFDKWKSVATTVPILKIQIITMDGVGSKYVLVYLITKSGKFQVARWDMETGAYNSQTIATDVVDFSVDANYLLSSASRRVFATYVKSSNMQYSARSTIGSYGFDWVDETSLGISGEQIAFAFGTDGGCYTTFIGYSTRSLWAIANGYSNDPASWGVKEKIVDGSVKEFHNPSIRAARMPFLEDNVLIVGSYRISGSTEPLEYGAFKRDWGYKYIDISDVPGWTDSDNVYLDTWIRRSEGELAIETAWVLDKIDNSNNGTAHCRFVYAFSSQRSVSDPDINVFKGFPPAIAQTVDRLSCMAFAATNGGYGWGLYFDAKTSLGIEENSFENFKFYPNPAQDVLNLSAKNTIDKVSIFSLLGQKVLDVSVNQNTASINTGSLTQGVYVMKVMIDGTAASYKIIKQ